MFSKLLYVVLMACFVPFVSFAAGSWTCTNNVVGVNNTCTQTTDIDINISTENGIVPLVSGDGIRGVVLLNTDTVSEYNQDQPLPVSVYMADGSHRTWGDVAYGGMPFTVTATSTFYTVPIFSSGKDFPLKVTSSTSTPIYSQDSGNLTFGLAILLVFVFLGFVGYLYNKFTPKKKPWLQ